MPSHRPSHSRPPASTNGLPTETVTFLFTDIAGSTGLLSRLGERYAEVLELSEERWKRAIEEGRAMDVETAVAQALESSEVAADG